MNAFLFTAHGKLFMRANVVATIDCAKHIDLTFTDSIA